MHFSLLQRSKSIVNPLIKFHIRAMSTGASGCGAGKGGGAGGTIREAGGSLGEQAAAREEQYFYNQQIAQMKKLKETISTENQSKDAQVSTEKEAQSQKQ